jgi:predicted alpha/beta hydrolase family esterase
MKTHKFIMKNALILHGTDGNSQQNWFDWLRQELEERNWQVWVPNLPDASTPNIERYNTFLLKENTWEFNNESVLIGHSSGAVAILGLLQVLPGDVNVSTCYLVGAFKDDLNWEALKGLFTKPFDFAKIKTKADKFSFIHSDNDPYCPLEHAQFLAHELDGELIVQPGQKHFSIGSAGEQYAQFPFLLRKIVKDEFGRAVSGLLDECRPGDTSHAFRVVRWVEQLAQDRDDWERLIKAAFVHDLGWYKVVPKGKLTKDQLKQLEPLANAQSEEVIRKFLIGRGEEEAEIMEILRLVTAADKHSSSTDDEAIIVDADNLSKLTIDHVIEKYQPSDWLKMLELWQKEFPQRIKTEQGKKLYPELLEELEREVRERLSVG